MFFVKAQGRSFLVLSHPNAQNKRWPVLRVRKLPEGNPWGLRAQRSETALDAAGRRTGPRVSLRVPSGSRTQRAKNFLVNVPLLQGPQPLLSMVPTEPLAFGGTRNQADSVDAKSQQLQRTREASSSGFFFQAAINQSWVFKTLQLEMQLVLPA